MSDFCRVSIFTHHIITDRGVIPADVSIQTTESSEHTWTFFTRVLGLVTVSIGCVNSLEVNRENYIMGDLEIVYLSLTTPIFRSKGEWVDSHIHPPIQTLQ